MQLGGLLVAYLLSLCVRLWLSSFEVAAVQKGHDMKYRNSSNLHFPNPMQLTVNKSKRHWELVGVAKCLPNAPSNKR